MRRGDEVHELTGEGGLFELRDAAVGEWTVDVDAGADRLRTHAVQVVEGQIVVLGATWEGPP